MFDTFNPSNCNVAVLAGGSSGEREISLASGQGAIDALKEAGFKTTLLDPAKKDDLKLLMDGSFDIAFLCLHGRKGEDGTIQGFLETIGLPYTGSGVCASAIAMDKSKAKLMYEAAGIPTPQSITLTKDDEVDVTRIIETLGSHCVVKAATEGSSLGVYIVEGEDELRKALDEVFDYDNHIVIERYVAGRELTVAVLGNEDASALPIIEIIPQNDSYDFDSKYLPGGSQHICPAEFSDEMTEKIKTLAVAAHHALGCEGVSRSDFIVDAEGTSWMLETNTIPGMTGTSLLPDAARAAGMSFSDLCVKMVKNALFK